MGVGEVLLVFGGVSGLIVVLLEGIEALGDIRNYEPDQRTDFGHRPTKQSTLSQKGLWQLLQAAQLIPDMLKDSVWPDGTHRNLEAWNQDVQSPSTTDYGALLERAGDILLIAEGQNKAIETLSDMNVKQRLTAWLDDYRNRRTP